MGNDNNISYSYQFNGTGSESGPLGDESGSSAVDSDLFAFDLCEILDLPDGNVLLVSKSSGLQLSVTRDVSIALKYCQEFRTLNEHARFLVSYMPELGGDEAGVEQVLTSVRDAGFMASAADICQRINRAPDSSAETAPSCVCIITCDRPDAVERLLESMLRGARLSKHERFYLVDDSRDALNAAHNQSAVESFNLTSPVEMAYIGESRQKQLLDALITALPEQERAVRFLIDREKWSNFKSYGLARTVCLLLSVGKRCIIMDDDVICSALESPHKEAGVKFKDGMGGADFYSTAQEWQSSSTPASADPLSGHAKCLGMGLSQALNALGHEALKQQDLKNADIQLISALHADAPILITQCGSFGDPGTAGNSWLYTLGPDSLNRLMSSRGGLNSAFENRQYWLGRTTPTFSKCATMSQVTGLDNSHILPPYFPVFRGEDLIFGNIVDFLYPDSLVLEYDWAVPHLPLEERKGNTGGGSTATMGSIELCVDYITGRRPVDREVSFQTRLETLCLILLELSENSIDGILTIFHSELARTRVDTVKTLSDKISETSHQPQDWVAYLKRCLDENVKTLQSKSSLADISGIPGDMENESVAGQIKDYAREYALALRAWPAIREAAPGITERLEG